MCTLMVYMKVRQLYVYKIDIQQRCYADSVCECDSLSTGYWYEKTSTVLVYNLTRRVVVEKGTCSGHDNVPAHMHSKLLN